MTSSQPARSPDDERVVRRLLRAFRDRFGASSGAEGDAVVARAPGRVNLIGDHTDYNDGFVLPATIDRAVYVAARPRGDARVRLHSSRFDEEVAYDLDAPPFDALPAWARYVAGVAEELRVRTGAATGFEASICGTVPLGAGLSSSAALEVATALALDGLLGLDLDPVEAARLCQHVEQTYVGVECGIMDQFASRLGPAGHALFLDCRSLDYDPVPLPFEDACLVLTDSRVSRELASSKYNERREECREAVAFFRQFDSSVEALRDVSEDLLAAHGPDLPAPLYRRARHVVRENERVRQAGALLAERQIDAFGALMNASHASLRDDYAVSAEELDALVEIAQSTEGVFGARMTGAGFGGCTVALVRPEALPELVRRTEERYERRFGRTPGIYVVERNLEAELFSAESIDVRPS